MGNERDKKEKTFRITHAGELLIWLVIVLIIVMSFTISRVDKELNDEHHYQVFLPDVDGLIVGSPVRMMGIEVGHVIKIKPVKNEVYVKFQLTNPDVYIPQGTRVTVEFTGLAGSKSLEIYLPEKDTYIDSNSALITAIEPKRLHDAMGLFNEMYKKFMSIIYSSSDFSAKLNTIDFEANRGDDLKKFMDFSNKSMEKSQKMLDEFKANTERQK